MTTRCCPVCGVLEDRTRDRFGRETTNLDPFTDKCVTCLIKGVKAKPMPATSEPADYKAVQAGERHK